MRNYILRLKEAWREDKREKDDKCKTTDEDEKGWRQPIEDQSAGCCQILNAFIICGCNY